MGRRAVDLLLAQIAQEGEATRDPAAGHEDVKPAGGLHTELCDVQLVERVEEPDDG